MASIANPLWQSTLIPGSNPTGNNIAIPNPVSTANSAVPTSSGSNPILASSQPSPSPTVASGATNPATAGFSANQGAYQSGSLVPTSSTSSAPAPGNNTGSFTSSMSPAMLTQLSKNLNSTYGEGLGSQIYQFLTTGAGFNQQAVNNLLASLQPGIERGEEDLMTQFSASGNRFGSGAQIGLGDYLSQVNLNEGEIETQMYETSLNDFINTLMGAGSTAASLKAGQPSVWDDISGSLGLASAAGSAVGASGAGGTAGDIGDILAGLGA